MNWLDWLIDWKSQEWMPVLRDLNECRAWSTSANQGPPPSADHSLPWHRFRPSRHPSSHRRTPRPSPHSGCARRCSSTPHFSKSAKLQRPINQSIHTKPWSMSRANKANSVQSHNSSVAPAAAAAAEVWADLLSAGILPRKTPRSCTAPWPGSARTCSIPPTSPPITELRFRLQLPRRRHRSPRAHLHGNPRSQNDFPTSSPTPFSGKAQQVVEWSGLSEGASRGRPEAPWLERQKIWPRWASPCHRWPWRSPLWPGAIGARRSPRRPRLRRRHRAGRRRPDPRPSHSDHEISSHSHWPPPPTRPARRWRSHHPATGSGTWSTHGMHRRRWRWSGAARRREGVRILWHPRESRRRRRRPWRSHCWTVTRATTRCGWWLMRIRQRPRR